MKEKIHGLTEMIFRRRFSVNLYKSLRMPLGEMSLYTDWVNTKRGDPYPLISSEGQLFEEIGRDTVYIARNASESVGIYRRLLGQHFPYASYELILRELRGAAGFSFICRADGRSEYTAENAPALDILVEGDKENGYAVRWDVRLGGRTVKSEKTGISPLLTPGTAVSVSARGDEFDVFADNGGKPELVCSLEVPEFSEIRKQINFTACAAALCVSLPAEVGEVCAHSISWYLEGGVAQADMRPIRYTDGTPMTENGRLFFTMSSRIIKGGFQSVISWNPSGCDFRLEGALFFDAGDGVWCADVASSVLYDKSSDTYLIWMCSFSHDHILAHGISKGDIRYGISVIDVTLLPVEKYLEHTGKDGTDPGGVKPKGRPTLADDRTFAAKYGDEDPDFYFDEEKNCWFLTVCRPSAEMGGKYEYFRFKSTDPFEGYRFVDKTGNREETGGSTVKIGDQRYFICGAFFGKRAVYNAYELGRDDEKFHFVGNLKCDYDDGGFRGWGTVVPVRCGNRTKYVWLTFDRHLGSPTYNWSYGNIYAFESDLMN